MATTEDTSRHTHWWCSTVSSIIALVALLKEVGDLGDEGKQTKWSASGISCALSLSGLAVLAAMLLREKFVGTHLEGGFAVLTFGILASVMPAIMEPGANIAVDGGGAIHNQNLYFASWGAFIMSLFVLARFMKDKLGSRIESTFPFGTWAALCMTSFVTMAAATRLFKDESCDDRKGDDFCDRTKFAVILGLVSACFSFFWMFLGARMGNDMFNAAMAFLLLAAWVFGVSFITFGDERPAKVLGNLYFATWASFGVACSLAGPGIVGMLEMVMGGSSGGAEPEEQVDASDENKDEGDDKAVEDKIEEQDEPDEEDPKEEKET